MIRFARAAAVALLSMFLLAGCSGSASGPTAPSVSASSTSGQILSTAAGTMSVVSHGCGESLDLRRMENEVYTTDSIAARQNPSVFEGRALLEGFEIHARTPGDSNDRCHGNPACFEKTSSGGRLHVWCDGGGLEHETAHALGWGGHLSCWETVYHGVNFRCERTSDPYGA